MNDFTAEEAEQFEWAMSEFRSLNKFNQDVASYKKAYEKAQQKYQKALEGYILGTIMADEDEYNDVVQQMLGDHLSDVANVQSMRRDVSFLESIVDNWEGQLHSVLEDLGLEST